MPTRDEWLRRIQAMTIDQRLALQAAAVPRIVEGYIPHVPHPAQIAFLLRSDREVFYGGAGGGGKSDALIMAATQYIDVPGYAALILRRTFRDLSQPGAIMDRADQWFSGTGARHRIIDHRWEFPTADPRRPATITFGYMQRDADVEQYRGAEYQCVAVGTHVQMADGYTKPIEQIRVGDMVRTLQGASRVTASRSTGIKPVVRVTTPYGSALVSETHPLLTAEGWTSPLLLRSTRSQHDGTPIEASAALSPISGMPFASISPDRQLRAVSLPVVRQSAVALAAFGIREDQQNGFSGPDDLLRENQPLQEWSASLVLLPPVHGSAESSDEGGHLRRALIHDRDESASATDSTDRYSSGCGRHGEQVLLNRGGVPERTPSRVDAGALFPPHSKPGGRGRTLERIPRGRYTYSHPYSSMLAVAREGVLLADVAMTPAGEAATWDVTVEGPNHYVLACAIVSRNCILWDELTQFNERPYRFLFSRLRGPALDCMHCRYKVTFGMAVNDATGEIEGPKWSHDEDYDARRNEPHEPEPDRSRLPSAPDGTTLADVPLRMRAASNPGGPGHEWVRHRLVDEKTAVAGSVFIPATLRDNPSINRSQYREGLADMTSVERARIEDGDWDAADEGTLFKRESIEIIDGAGPEPRTLQLARFWDLAATAPAPGKDPDWTAGVMIGLESRTGIWWILDAVRIRATPAGVEALIVQVAAGDRYYDPYVRIRMEQEPGSAGVNNIAAYRRILAGYDFDAKRSTGSKFERARALGVAAENGMVKMISGDWNRWLIDEMVAFPGGAHDDSVDAAAGAFNSIANASHFRVLV